MFDRTRAATAAERFHILRWLGRGGMADVFLAEDRAHGRRVALKQARAGGGSRADAAIEREGRILARLDHRAVVRLHEVNREAAHPRLVLAPAGAPWPARRRAEADVVVRVAAGLSAALAHVHARGVLHLDVKRDNVLLDGDGMPTLVDFGIAACEEEPEVGDAGYLIGTPQAMAPEQVLGDPVDARSDLFALGALLYELASGSPPFVARSLAETLERVIAHRPPPVAVAAPALPRRLAELVDHLLEKDAVLRPQSAAEVAAHVAAC